jgi:hypothetical protein
MSYGCSCVQLISLRLLHLVSMVLYADTVSALTRSRSSASNRLPHTILLSSSPPCSGLALSFIGLTAI